MAGKTKAGAPNEAAIRDFLAERLDLIEPGLTLIGMEFKLPSIDGAAGFLDIFARDARGKLVIVEIKRTRGAAREALQELYKYAALLRERRLVQETDYRLLLLAVDWNDLMVPYSEFIPHAPFEVAAGRILLGSDGLPVGIEAVEPIANAPPRRIAVRHMMWGFPNEQAAEAGLDLLAESMRARGLVDFVFVQSRPSAPVYEGRVFLYFAQQEQRFADYMALLEAACSAEALADFQEHIEGLTEPEDLVAEAGDAAWWWPDGPVSSNVGGDHLEIGNPEKAHHWFEEIEQDYVRIHRFGRFVDPWISDETILRELTGEEGASDYRLRCTARTNSPPEMAALRRKVENVFFFNPDWRGAVEDLIRYAERKPGVSSLELVAFSNEDILRAVAGSAFGYPGYVPMFRLEITEGGENERFLGMPEWDGTPFDYDALMADHFGGNRFSYFIAAHLGENRHMNRDIMADLGLRYAVFREGADGKPERIRVTGSSIVAEKRAVGGGIPTLISQNIDQVHRLVECFMTSDQGFARTIEAFVNSPQQQAERILAEQIEAQPRPKEVLYWCGELIGCDLCQHPFVPLRFMVDTHLPNGGGASVCARCFLAIGGLLGWGRGQAYEATAEGWLLVAGGPTD